jgi:hypothetical protein
VRASLETLTPRATTKMSTGFQGQLLVELWKRIPTYLPSDSVIIEQEHQKTLDRHGLTIRPDIIIHEPFDPARHTSRRRATSRCSN